jgi:hypothetical protein
LKREKKPVSPGALGLLKTVSRMKVDAIEQNIPEIAVVGFSRVSDHTITMEMKRIMRENSRALDEMMTLTKKSLY